MDATDAKQKQQLSPKLARALIRSLTRGVAIARGVRYIHVGHENWLAAQDELLEEVAEDGHSDTKFVRGAYGAGKSHFLAVVQDRARESGWMTSHIECKVDRVQIDRFETLYPSIVRKMQCREMTDVVEGDASMSLIDPVRALMDRWTRRQMASAGVRDGGLTRPFDADGRLFRVFQAGILATNLMPDFAHALVAYARAHNAQDGDTMRAVCRWLQGGEDTLALPIRYLRAPSLTDRSDAVSSIRPIGKGTAHEVMRGLLWLIRSAGHAGLVLCIDEVEELAKLGSRKRQDQALQALREYVDHAGGEGGYTHLCMYLAATPEMFEGPDYFPRYDALATRIQAFSPELNWRAPVIDLDRTPLGATEMREMGMRIWAAHHVGYGDLPADRFTAEFVGNLVDRLIESRFRIAKPRLLARVMVDELERIRQAGHAYTLPADVVELVTQTALNVSKEAEGPQ